MTELTLDDVEEIAFGATLELIAMGEDKRGTEQQIRGSWSALDDERVARILKQALKEALEQGVEREDIDPSWF